MASGVSSFVLTAWPTALGGSLATVTWAFGQLGDQAEGGAHGVVAQLDVVALAVAVVVAV